jgi:serine protease Do
MLLRRFSSCVFLSICLVRCADSPTSNTPPWDEIVRRVGSGVVSITAWKSGADEDEETLGVQVQVGTGIVYRADGLILTNQHVIRDAVQIRVDLPENQGSYQAEILGGDDRSDIAVLRLKTRGAEAHPQLALHELEWASSAAARVGEPIVAIGNPYGLGHSVTTGVLSSTERIAPLGLQGNGWGGGEADSVLQTDAAIHPGSSGGPLLNRHGRVLGLTTLYFSPSGEPSGIAFAIPSDRLRAIADGLISNGWIRRAWLGLSAQEIDPGMSLVLGGFGAGVLITEVGALTPAGGILRPGDLIVEWAGRPVRRLLDFRERVQSTIPGAEVELALIRDGEFLRRLVRPSEWGVDREQRSRISRPKSERRRSTRLARQSRKAPGVEFLGMHLVQMTSVTPTELRASVLNRGVRIESIDSQSPAWSAGLSPGDWIMEVNGQPLTGTEALPSMLTPKELGDIIFTIRQGGVHGPRLYRWISRELIQQIVAPSLPLHEKFTLLTETPSAFLGR